ncbi:MAG: hypothetical protein RL341_1956 [Pseudomonadota bacterium]|jgi:hypothetical protein
MNATIAAVEVKIAETKIEEATRAAAVVELNTAQMLLVGGGRGSVSLE